MSSLNDVSKTKIKFWDDCTIRVFPIDPYIGAFISSNFHFLSSQSNIAKWVDLPEDHHAFTFYFYEISKKTNKIIKRLEFHFQNVYVLTTFPDSTVVEFVAFSSPFSKMKIDLKNLFLTSSVLNS